MANTRTKISLRPLALTLLLFVAFSEFPCSQAYLNPGKLLSRFKSATVEKVACKVCRVVTKGLLDLWQKNATEECVASAVAVACERLKLEDADICAAIVAQFKDEFLYVLGKVTLSPDQLCGLVFSKCGDPHNPLSEDWTLAIPGGKPAPQPNPRVIVGKPTLKVLQLSDLHFDMQYKPGAEAKCTQPTCCRPTSVGKTGQHISVPAKYWGTLASCDTPYWTIENMFQHIREKEELDYILISGDYMSHADWTYTKREHKQIIRNFTALLEHYFPNIPTFWTVGNHEGVPVNSFAPHYAPKKYWPTWLYRRLYKSWTKWLPSDAKTKHDILYRASYKTKIFPRLKLISLNTGYCDKTNFWVYLNQTDPDGTLAWLIKQLTFAEKAGQKVQILAHIPTGNSECMEGWAKNYYRIVNRFESTIVGQFFGHTHVDSLTMFYEDMNDYKSRPTNVMFIGPSVTTFVNVNPSYRIYTIDGLHHQTTFQVIDYETWFLNLTKLGGKETTPNWEMLYSAKDEYKLPDMSPRSWSTLVEKVVSDPKVYQTFVRNYARNANWPCDEECKKDTLCSLRSGHHNTTGLCPDIHPNRRQKYHVDLPNETKLFSWSWLERQKLHLNCSFF